MSVTMTCKIDASNDKMPPRPGYGRGILNGGRQRHSCNSPHSKPVTSQIIDLPTTSI